MLSATICIDNAAEVGDCDPAPTLQIIIGPGSTARVSAKFAWVAQDLRVYGIVGEDYEPTDPGPFPDDLGNAGDPESAELCVWNHPFVPDATNWARGRKICKTVIEFEAVELTWQFDRALCQWLLVANDVTVKVGVETDIDETGTPATAGTTHLRIEQDLQQEFQCRIRMNIHDVINWCPGDEEAMLCSFTVTRMDGDPFPRPWNEDWTDEDALDAAWDSVPFPDLAGTPGDSSTYNWPGNPLYSSDRREISCAMTLAPNGRVAMEAASDRTTFNGQVHGDVDNPETLMIGRATGAGGYSLIGAVSLFPSGSCYELTECSECTAHPNQTPLPLPCIGWTFVCEISGSPSSWQQIEDSCDWETLTDTFHHRWQQTLVLRCNPTTHVLETVWKYTISTSSTEHGESPVENSYEGYSTYPSWADALAARVATAAAFAGPGTWGSFGGSDCDLEWVTRLIAPSGDFTDEAAPVENHCDTVCDDGGLLANPTTWPEPPFPWPEDFNLATGTITCAPTLCPCAPSYSDTRTKMGEICTSYTCLSPTFIPCVPVHILPHVVERVTVSAG